MDILILHGLDNTDTWLSAVTDVELMFPKYDKENNYLLHSGQLPLPAELAFFPFAAVIIMSTFMDRVVQYGLSGKWIKQYEFLKRTRARKIAFPQDDYWQCEVRDRFYVEWGVDEVHPVCAPNTWSELIPKYLSSGRLVQQGYTSYVTPFMRNLSTLCKPWSERSFDVVYRASQMLTAPNRLGDIKRVLGKRFLETVGPNAGIKIDVDNGHGGMILGSAWHTFIADSRAILGSNSGSSIRLRNALVARQLIEYQRLHPYASIEKIERDVLPSEDYGKCYTAISPRNIEAAILGTLQILVPGTYSEILESNKHYVPLDEDCNNALEVVELLRDTRRCQQIIEACRDRVLGAEVLSAEMKINDVLGRVQAHFNHIPTSDSLAFNRLKNKYALHIKLSKAKRFYSSTLKVLIWKNLPEVLRRRLKPDA